MDIGVTGAKVLPVSQGNCPYYSSCSQVPLVLPGVSCSLQLLYFLGSLSDLEEKTFQRRQTSEIKIVLLRNDYRGENEKRRERKEKESYQIKEITYTKWNIPGGFSKLKV